MSRQKAIWTAVLMVGVIPIWFYGVSRPSPEVEPQFVESSSPSPTETPVPGPVQRDGNVGASNQSAGADATGQAGTFKYPPAECLLTGSITFISPGLYENKDANIIYKNIDSVARLVIWKISPDDGLSIGPNLFANLPLPDGAEDITVRLPENPKSKNYILTANVTYGVFVNRNLEIKESSCSGQIPVEIKY